MEAVSKIYLKLRYYFKLWRLNLDLKSVSEDACLRSKGKYSLKCTLIDNDTCHHSGQNVVDSRADD